MDCHQICCTTGPCKRLTNYPKKFTGLATTSGKQVHCANIKNCHCPLCQHEQEIPWHFLECQHPHRTQLFLQFQCSLSSLHSTAKIDPHMFQLLWQGLSSIQQQYSIDDHISTISTYVSSSMEHRMGPIFLWPNCYILDHPHWPQHPDKNKWNYILLTNDIPSLGVHPGIIARAQQCPTLPDPRATFNIRYWNPKYCRSSSKLLMTLFYMAMNPTLWLSKSCNNPFALFADLCKPATSRYAITFKLHIDEHKWRFETSDLILQHQSDTALLQPPQPLSAAWFYISFVSGVSFLTFPPCGK